MRDMRDVYARIDIESLLTQIGEVKDKGAYWLFTCPQCGQMRAYFYKDSGWYTCNRKDKCGAQGSLYDIVSMLKGIDRSDTKALTKELCMMAGVWEEHHENVSGPSNAREALKKYCIDLLWSEKGKSTRKYLNERGYDDVAIAGMGLGYCPTKKELRDHLALQGYSDAVIKDIGLDEFDSIGRTHTVMVPYVSYDGLRGFAIRAITDAKIKYLYNQGLDKSAPLGLRKMRDEFSVLLVVEGVFDALYACHKGLKTACAIGGSNFTHPMIESALKAGYRRFCLCLDNDAAGREGTAKAIRDLARMGHQVYVLDLFLLDPAVKDIDEYLRTVPDGAERIKEAMQGAQRGVRWLARDIVADIEDEKLSDAQIDELFDRAAKDATTFVDIRDKKLYLEDVGDRIGLTRKELEHKWRLLVERDAKERQTTAIQEKNKKIGEHIDRLKASFTDGRMDLVESLLKESNKIIEVGIDRKYLLKPDLEDIRNEIMLTGDGIATGYKEIDKYIMFPAGGVSIIAARPGHGKTTAMVNLCNNALEMYPDKMFIYSTLEENAIAEIGPKFINVMAAENRQVEPFESRQHLRRLKYYISHFENMQKSLKPEWDRPNVARAMRKFEDYVLMGRLRFTDRVRTPEQIIAMLEEAKREGLYSIGGIYLDYVQKFRSDKEYLVRAIEMKNVSEAILDITKDYYIPGIGAAQFGRKPTKQEIISLDNLRECGDFEQDAQVVLGVWNDIADRKKKKDTSIDVDAREIPLEVSLLKVRGSAGLGKDFNLIFDRPYGKLWDEDKITTQNFTASKTTEKKAKPAGFPFKEKT